MPSHVLIIPYISLCHYSQGRERLVGLLDTALSPSQHLQVYDLWSCAYVPIVNRFSTSPFPSIETSPVQCGKGKKKAHFAIQ